MPIRAPMEPAIQPMVTSVSCCQTGSMPTTERMASVSRTKRNAQNGATQSTRRRLGRNRTLMRFLQGRGGGDAGSLLRSREERHELVELVGWDLLAEILRHDVGIAVGDMGAGIHDRLADEVLERLVRGLGRTLQRAGLEARAD